MLPCLISIIWGVVLLACGGAEARDAAEHPTVHRTDSCRAADDQNGSSAETKKRCIHLNTSHLEVLPGPCSPHFRPCYAQGITGYSPSGGRENHWPTESIPAH